MKKQIGSISGGATSHFMISEMIEKFGSENCLFVCCDTGAEKEGTYDFIRKTEKHFGVEIVYLRMELPLEEGVGLNYKVVSRDDFKKDYKPFLNLMQKYGRPFNPGGKFCTDQLKTQVARKYCNENFPNGYNMWIGYRDEPKDSSRVWGHSLSGMLSKWFSIPQAEQGDFYKDCCAHFNESIGCLFDFVSSKIIDPLSKNNYKRVVNVVDRVVKNHQLGYKFLFEISDFDKKEINDWWDEQDFKLEIPQHTGNCIFCIEKTINQLCYLILKHPKDAQEWLDIVEHESIPEKNRKFNEMLMYRNGKDKFSFRDLVDMAKSERLEFWEEKLGMEKRLSPCAGGSCDLYNADEQQAQFDF